MDDIESLVAETFRHFQDHFPGEQISMPPMDPFAEIPDGPGLIYHLQKSTSVFVIRTLVSSNVREDYKLILEDPTNYPSLRLIDEQDSSEMSDRIKFFSVSSAPEAEIIHDQLNNRRFPIFEETLCNISDPGFSWWLTKIDSQFQLSFNLSVQSEGTVKLGPLGDQQLAARNLSLLSEMFHSVGLEYCIQNEGNRILFGDENALLLEEFQSIFEFGQVGAGMINVFKILARRHADATQMETCWYYLQEVAAIRRFWIQIEFDLTI